MRIDENKARLVAIEYCLFHYPTLYTGGVPRRSLMPAMDSWIVPIVLEDPEAGISEKVGELHIDAQSGQVVASTPGAEVVAAGRRLYGERKETASAKSNPDELCKLRNSPGFVR